MLENKNADLESRLTEKGSEDAKKEETSAEVSKDDTVANNDENSKANNVSEEPAESKKTSGEVEAVDVEMPEVPEAAGDTNAPATIENEEKDTGKQAEAKDQPESAPEKEAEAAPATEVTTDKAEEEKSMETWKKVHPARSYKLSMWKLK